MRTELFKEKNTMKILVVDDDKEIAQLLEIYIKTKVTNQLALIMDAKP